MRTGVAVALSFVICAGVGGRTEVQPAGLIVFNATPNGAGAYNELYVANLDTGRVRRLTRSGASILRGHPTEGRSHSTG